MYFAIAWKNKLLSEYELSLIWNILHKEGSIFFFDTENFEKCKNLAGFVKVWKIVSLDEFIKMEKKLVWTNIRLKPSDKEKYQIKRYKHIELIKSDLEIKNKWLEVIFFKSFKDKVWIVKFYQNIKLYESIDFSKPVRSMDIWMMPSKLTHLMLNYATKLDYNKTIYDPFSGLWTWLMIANHFGNNVIWSDINISPTKQNWKWFQTTEFFNPSYKYFFFKQDVTKPLKTKIVNFADYVVTEWYLWPKVWKFLNFQEAEKLEKSFQNVYILGIKNLLNLENLKKIVITFPVYYLKNKEFYYFQDTYDQIKKFANIEILEEVYIRKNQKVWRQIAMIERT